MNYRRKLFKYIDAEGAMRIETIATIIATSKVSITKIIWDCLYHKDKEFFDLFFSSILLSIFMHY